MSLKKICDDINDEDPSAAIGKTECFLHAALHKPRQEFPDTLLGTDVDKNIFWMAICVTSQIFVL